MLAEVVAEKRRAVASRRSARSLASLREGLEPTDRSLVRALRREHPGFILECKASSPSQGSLRRGYDPRPIAAAYAPFADVIAVWTDEPHFGGSLAHLDAVRSTAPQPVLCKDFVVDPYQVYEARRHGADAISLFVSVLPHEELRACIRAAESLGMDCLVEVHDENEARSARDAGATVIGIDNRDLTTLEIDRNRAARLAPLVPPECLVVCESGIRHHRDVLAMRDLVDGFVVGTSLMRQPNLHQAVRELIFGRVKICGLTAHADALAARTLGATHGGVVLSQSSPRGLTVEDARHVMSGVDLAWVGVFANAPPTFVRETARSLGLSAVQLDGEESRRYAQALEESLPAGCELWRTQRVREPGTVIGTASFHGAKRLLLDVYTRGIGGDERFDWDVALDHPERRSLVLSGAITPDTAERAQRVGCWALDVSSGVEERRMGATEHARGRPGRKDAGKLEALFAELRGRARA
jgi:indole-3-glycerol phosphate synthase / phosphoribosylanthranilate isomerase